MLNMFWWGSICATRRFNKAVIVGLAIFLVALTTFTLFPSPLRDYLPTRLHRKKPLPHHEAGHTVSSCEGANNRTTFDKNRLSLPSEYDRLLEESPFCAARFGREYLDELRDSATEYCSADPISSLTCFHSRTAQDQRTDSFCVARDAALDTIEKKFHIGCELRDLTKDENQQVRNAPRLSDFSRYWYETGPRYIFDHFVELSPPRKPSRPVQDSKRIFTLLLKREGAFNTWHSLMEIFSMTMTMDILQMTKDPRTGAPFFTTADIKNTQVLVLDEHEEGPYFDLWTLFAQRPVLRLSNLTDSDQFGRFNAIIPLPGASNPTWQGDWEVNPCTKGSLLQVFSRRVLNFYSATESDSFNDRDDKVKVTFIDRVGSRRLLNSAVYLEELKKAFPRVEIQSIDFAAIPFREQVRISHQTDVLVGVHGAGLAHGMFLQEGSAMVEILPAELDHKGFHNLAKLLGHTYFRTHARKPRAKRDAWHHEDVFLEKQRFVELVGAAIKSVYSKGSRSYDVN